MNMQPSVQTTVVQTARYWWIVLVVGIVSLAFGLVMLFDVAEGEKILAWIVGLFLIFEGLVEAFAGGRTGRSRVLAVVIGIVLIAGGVVVISWPGATPLVIAIVIGIAMLLGGIGRIIASVWLRDSGWAWRLVGGVIETAIAIAILNWPDATAYVILILIGIDAIISGIVQIVLSFEIKNGPDAIAVIEVSAP